MAPEESNPASSNTKRKATLSISPPAIKRKAQSSISKSAVNNFFKPTSQKPKERTSWSERAAHNDTPATLLVGRYEPEGADQADEANQKRTKIAAFDFDSTLITTASGKKFGDDPNDWKWWDPTVPTTLKHMYAENYRIIILSNQAGLTLHRDPKAKGPKNLGRVENFKQKCNAVLAQLDIPISVYAATGHDIYRKPRIGMWKELCKDYDIEAEIDRENSLFVGDAGGRTAQLKQNSNSSKAVAAKDFSCSDRNFAHNLEIVYKTPEEFFLGEEPREFLRDFVVAQHPYADDDGIIFEKNDKDVVLFCGPPGAGKSTFFWRYLKPLGYERVNQDTLKSRAKCFKAAADHLGEGKSVAIDNTNPDAGGRAEWIEFAKQHKIPIRCVWFKTPLELCQHNDTVRALNKPIMNPEAREALPKLAFNAFASRFKEPNKTKEGFQDVLEVEFKFRGTREEYAIWGRYWT